MTNTETTATVPFAAAAVTGETADKAKKVGTAAKKAAKLPSEVTTAKAKPAAKKAASKKATSKKAAKAATKRQARADGEASKSVIPLDVAKSYTRTKIEVKGEDGKKRAKTVVDNDDPVATMLRGKSLDVVYTLAAKKCDMAEKDLRTKYGHLNQGMQRMNLGNKLRAAMAA